MSERPEDLELTTLESALRDLRPRPEALDRAVLMYRAGRASARGWHWPLATASAMTLAAGLGILLLIRPAPPLVERIVYRPAPAVRADGDAPEVENERAVAPETPNVPGTPDAAWQRYLRMQDQVLHRGLDGLPPPPAAPSNAEPATVESLLNAL